MLDEKLPISLYYQLKNVFISYIKSGDWPVNFKISTERQLCEMFNVSRITVRQALKELEDEGHMYRKQGKGTFVTTPKFVQRLSRFYSFSDEIRKMGAVPCTKKIKFVIGPADKSISEKLELEVGEKVFTIKRLRLANDEPFAMEASYIPFKFVENLTEEFMNELGLYNTLKQKCNLEPEEASETFEAVLADHENAELLKVPRRSAALHVERITTAQGRIVEYCISTIRGDKYKYTVNLK
jgi:GntR family transcriptional regulator